MRDRNAHLAVEGRCHSPQAWPVDANPPASSRRCSQPDCLDQRQLPPTAHDGGTDGGVTLRPAGTCTGADADPAHATAAERVWRVVASIPAGQVATYGQIADLAGLPGGARRVGRVLAALPTDSRLPWHRVINAAGRVSLPGAHGARQRRLLRAEGVYFRNQRVDLRRHRWTP